MTIAITGATGQLGRLVISTLKGKTGPAAIAALARNPAKADDLGVEVRQADYAQPATLADALVGVETLLLISSSEVGQRIAQHLQVITAAKNAKVRRVVYTSVLHADTSPLALAEEHRATESALRESGLAHTILRNGWYTENYTAAIGPALANGALVGSAGDGLISSATRADYAEAAVAALIGGGHEGKTYELAGDQPYTLSDLAAEISRQSGKTIPYVNLPPLEYAAILAKAGLPEGFARMIASADDDASRGALHDDGRQLSALIGRPTTTLTQAVAEALKP